MDKVRYYIHFPWNIGHKKNEVLIHTTKWMSLENIMLSERSQSQKSTYLSYHLHDMYRIGKFIEIKSRLVVA